MTNLGTPVRSTSTCAGRSCHGPGTIQVITLLEQQACRLVDDARRVQLCTRPVEEQARAL